MCLLPGWRLLYRSLHSLFACCDAKHIWILLQILPRCTRPSPVHPSIHSFFLLVFTLISEFPPDLANQFPSQLFAPFRFLLVTCISRVSFHYLHSVLSCAPLRQRRNVKILDPPLSSDPEYRGHIPPFSCGLATTMLG
jgi:hypothetical protein